MFREERLCATGILAGAKALTYHATGYKFYDYLFEDFDPEDTEPSTIILWVFGILLFVAFTYAKWKGRKDGEITIGWLIKRTLIVYLKILFFYIVIPIKVIKLIIRLFTKKKTNDIEPNSGKTPCDQQ